MSGDGEHMDGLSNRGDHATYRELKESEAATDKRLRAVELEVASQRAHLMHLPEDVRQLTTAVNQMASRMPVATAASADPAMTQMLLAMQRTLDVLSKQQPHSNVRDIIELMQTRGQSGGKTWALVGALAVLAVLMGWRAFTG
jgi:hypothetical protein